MYINVHVYTYMYMYVLKNFILLSSGLTAATRFGGVFDIVIDRSVKNSEMHSRCTVVSNPVLMQWHCWGKPILVTTSVADPCRVFC